MPSYDWGIMLYMFILIFAIGMYAGKYLGVDQPPNSTGAFYETSNYWNERHDKK